MGLYLFIYIFIAPTLSLILNPSNNGILTYCYKDYLKLFHCSISILPSNYIIVDKNCFLNILNFEKSMYVILNNNSYTINYLFVGTSERIDNYYLKTDAIYNYSIKTTYNTNLFYPYNKTKIIPTYINRFSCSNYNFQLYEKSLYTDTCDVYLI